MQPSPTSSTNPNAAEAERLLAAGAIRCISFAVLLVVSLRELWRLLSPSSIWLTLTPYWEFTYVSMYPLDWDSTGELDDDDSHYYLRMVNAKHTLEVDAAMLDEWNWWAAWLDLGLAVAAMAVAGLGLEAILIKNEQQCTLYYKFGMFLATSLLTLHLVYNVHFEGLMEDARRVRDDDFECWRSNDEILQDALFAMFPAIPFWCLCGCCGCCSFMCEDAKRRREELCQTRDMELRRLQTLKQQQDEETTSTVSTDHDSSNSWSMETDEEEQGLLVV